MTSKAVVPRERALGDVHDVIEYYLRKDEQSAALAFVDALEHAYDHIARHPGTGSLRYAEVTQIPGLRFWPLKDFPHMVFYVECPEHIEVRRILHGQRDIPASMRQS